MKYISNALLAMILALLANFGLVICFTRLRKPGGNAVLANIHRRFTYSEIRAVHTHQSEIYDPVSSGSDGGAAGEVEAEEAVEAAAAEAEADTAFKEKR